MNNCVQKLLLVFTALISVASCDPGPAQSAQRLDIAPQILSIPPPAKILFIGNSFTYFNGGIDRHLRELVRAAYPDRKVLIDSLTVPSQTVQGHFQGADTQRTLSRESWDVVIVQGASYEPIESDSVKAFDKYSALIAASIREQNAQVALFMTWSYRSKPSMIGPLASAYVQTGNDYIGTGRSCWIGVGKGPPTAVACLPLCRQQTPIYARHLFGSMRVFCGVIC